MTSDTSFTFEKLFLKRAVRVFSGREKALLAQAAQTHVAMEGCNVIYITYVTRAGVALQATVENIRDFV